MKSGPNFVTEIQYRKLPDGEFVNVTVSNGDNKYVIENAGENDKYEIIVRGKNDEGTGPETKAVLKSSGGGKASVSNFIKFYYSGGGGGLCLILKSISS